MAAPTNAPSSKDEEVWKDDDFLSLDMSDDKGKEAKAATAATSDSSSSKKAQESTAATAVGTALRAGRRSGPSAQSPTLPPPPPPLLPSQPPWVGTMPAVDSRRFHPVTVLHNEIVGFTQLMQPRPHEIAQRAALVRAVEALVHETFVGEAYQVQVFGSQATGLFLPTSDIDLVVQTGAAAAAAGDATKTNKNGSPAENKEAEVVDDLEKDWNVPSGTPLERLATALRERWIAKLSYLEVIANTRVPLVKFCVDGIQVDVCFDQGTGPPAAALMKTYLTALPPLRPLTFVLKYFLAARGLNEPYSGGVGSFMLQLMLVGFLQQRERDAVNYRRPAVNNLGCMLLEFLELFGLQFNYCTTGISVRHDGFFFPKGADDRKQVFWQPSRPFAMAMENPLDPTADVGKPSFRIGMVQRAFAVAYRLLLAHTVPPLETTADGSILATILPPTEEMRQRAAKNLKRIPNESANGAQELQSKRRKR